MAASEGWLQGRLGADRNDVEESDPSGARGLVRLRDLDGDRWAQSHLKNQDARELPRLDFDQCSIHD